MLQSLKARAAAFVVVLSVGALLGMASPASAASNANNAKLCQKGGWKNLVRADQTHFKNQGACVSYAAHGGTPAPPKSAAQLACESFGGTYGNTDLVSPVIGFQIVSVVWTCNAVPVANEPPALHQLSPPCSANGPSYQVFPAPGSGSVFNNTCGIAVV
jgi:hypothetical protein